MPCDTPAGPGGPGGPCRPTLFQVRAESPVGHLTELLTWLSGASAVAVLWRALIVSVAAAWLARASLPTPTSARVAAATVTAATLSQRRVFITAVLPDRRCPFRLAAPLAGAIRDHHGSTTDPSRR